MLHASFNADLFPLLNTITGFHLGFLSRGEGGKDYSNNSNAFSLARNIIELIDFLKLGGLWACSPRKILNFSISETVMVASETKFSGLGRSLLPVHCCFCEQIC